LVLKIFSLIFEDYWSVSINASFFYISISGGKNFSDVHQHPVTLMTETLKKGIDSQVFISILFKEYVLC
jgi:hypothetical protein